MLDPTHAGASGRPSDADETGGSILRLLHQLSLATTAAEALARAVPGPVPMFMAAMQGWGLAGSVLSLETLQRALALDNRARDLLVGAALSAGLVPALLARLDWRDAGGAGASSSVTPCPAGCSQQRGKTPPSQSGLRSTSSTEAVP